ncbi:hypothetical protein TCA2_5512 [Paenibacillus sp. TCA20]|nr:hypothetical protein TCA2_5512 [Paenibacillus sp. TCA20]
MALAIKNSLANNVPANVPKIMDSNPIIMFSRNIILPSWASVMPCSIKMPNSFFLEVRKELTEYSTNKKENTKIIHSATTNA